MPSNQVCSECRRRAREPHRAPHRVFPGALCFTLHHRGLDLVCKATRKVCSLGQRPSHRRLLHSILVLLVLCKSVTPAPIAPSLGTFRENIRRKCNLNSLGNISVNNSSIAEFNALVSRGLNIATDVKNDFKSKHALQVSQGFDCKFLTFEQLVAMPEDEAMRTLMSRLLNQSALIFQVASANSQDRQLVDLITDVVRIPCHISCFMEMKEYQSNWDQIAEVAIAVTTTASPESTSRDVLQYYESLSCVVQLLELTRSYFVGHFWPNNPATA